MNERIFALAEPPRWVVLMSIDSIALIDRAKWNASRLLRFDLAELFRENDPNALLAAATYCIGSILAPVRERRYWIDWMRIVISIPMVFRQR